MNHTFHGLDYTPCMKGFLFNIMETKRCTMCGELKPLFEFFKNKGQKDGLTCQCKFCIKIYSRNYRHTKLGLSSNIYGRQRQRSKRKGWSMPTYTLKEFRRWLFSQDWFHILFDKWVKSGYDKMLVPSCDRINDYKPYTLDNLQIITWDENNQKGNTDQKNGINNKSSKAVIGTHIMTGEVLEFYSMIEAERQTGIANQSISNCCRKKQIKYNNGKCYTVKSAGGFIWEYYNIKK